MFVDFQFHLLHHHIKNVLLDVVVVQVVQFPHDDLLFYLNLFFKTGNKLTNYHLHYGCDGNSKKHSKNTSNGRSQKNKHND